MALCVVSIFLLRTRTVAHFGAYQNEEYITPNNMQTATATLLQAGIPHRSTEGRQFVN
jgi:hypothetical protein